MSASGARTDLGATLRDDAVTFGVWAPRCRTIDVTVGGSTPVPLQRREDDVFEGTLAGVQAGARYYYRLDTGRQRPDPRSRWQPEGVHGPSAVVDPSSFAWADGAFRGHALADLVIYELHVGAFTPPGTFEAAIGRLPRLVDLGVTAVELMPIAEFPGPRNWGYDGAHLYAPQSTYGGPRGLRRFVDACHAHGLSVILDVVYNHFGPEGCYLGEYAPYLTDRRRTPWGDAVNFDGRGSPGVRHHVIDNAAFWVREFHVDGLRLDAVHAIADASPLHILTELAEAARAEARRLGRPVHVIAESHDNDRRLVLPREQGGLALDATWCEDFHHALHRRLTGEHRGYYTDYADPSRLTRALAEGFAFQGEPSAWYGMMRGTPSRDLPGERVVFFVQNHDLVGNRARGDRLGALVPLGAVKCAVALLLASPAIPLLFMGEEYGETAPFHFFTSFLDGALTDATRLGRRREFERLGWAALPPDPALPTTLAASRLDATLEAASGHHELREYYRAWLALRRAHPALGCRAKQGTRAEWDATGAVLTLTRSAPSGARVRLVANLSAERRTWTPEPAWRLLLDSEDARFGGGGGDAPLAPWQVLLHDAVG